MPECRKDTPHICIEHLYSDEEVLKEIGDPPNNKRLFMAKEFDKYGRGLDSSYFCTNRNKCSKGGIHIIDLDNDTKVLYTIEGDELNSLISKYKFAKEVVTDDFNFRNSVSIFERIRDILTK